MRDYSVRAANRRRPRDINRYVSRREAISFLEEAIDIVNFTIPDDTVFKLDLKIGLWTEQNLPKEKRKVKP